MIKKIAKNISKIGASLYNMDVLIKTSRHNIILPFYHAVTDGRPIHIKNLYEPRSIEAFKIDLEFLLENFESISLEKLIEINSGREDVSANYFHLTFDDGLSEFYNIVAPILKAKNIHATVFLNSEFIDNKKLFFRFKASILFEKLKDDSILTISYKEEHKLDELAYQNDIDFDNYLKENKPYLTTEQIKDLIAQGFTFGAHSKNHPLYKELSLEEQIRQTKESIEIVVNGFDLPYKVFSFPFTDDGVTISFFDEIAKETDLTFGCAGLKEDTAKNHLQRIPMETNKTGKEIIKEEYIYYLMKGVVERNKIVRR
jgi:peptidoglycan/xylan/chitin deacetylase (PgdA/CDA1 family)